MSANESAPLPLAPGDLARTFEREAQGWTYKRALEALLLELDSEVSEHLQLILREGRGAWLSQLASAGGKALFFGSSFSGTISALALQGFEVTLLDPCRERTRFALFRARALMLDRVHASPSASAALAAGPFALVVVEDAATADIQALERALAPDGELVLVADNRLGYKRSLGRKGEFRVPTPLEFARTTLAPPRGERTLAGWRRLLGQGRSKSIAAYALYPHQLDFSHVVALDRPRPALTIGPMEKKNRFKLAGQALGLFPMFAPSYALIGRLGGPQATELRVERILHELAQRWNEPRPEVEAIIATRGNSAVVHTRAGDGHASGGRWTLHIPLAPKNLPQTERHCAMLGQVRERFTGFPVPEPLFWGTLEGLTFSCERRLAGWTAPQACGDQPRIARMLAQVAELLQRLVVRPARPIDEALFETQIAARFRLVIEHAAVPSTIARLERLLGELRARLIGRPMPLVFYHADLRAKHVQVDERGNVLGILDWGTAEEEGLPYYDLLQLVVHEIKQEHGLSAGAAWRKLLAGELREYERACLESYTRAIGLDAEVARAIEEMYPVLVAAMAEKNWDYSRPRWLHRQFGL